MGCGQSKIHLYPRKSKSKANGKKSGHADSDTEADEDEAHQQSADATDSPGNAEERRLTDSLDESDNGEQATRDTEEDGSLPAIQRTKNLSLFQNNNKTISSSQQNFFRMLDKKIEDGPDYDSGSETEIALEEARLNSLVHHWESVSINTSVDSSASRSLQTTPIRQLPPFKPLVPPRGGVGGQLLSANEFLPHGMQQQQHQQTQQQQHQMAASPSPSSSSLALTAKQQFLGSNLLTQQQTQQQQQQQFQYQQQQQSHIGINLDQTDSNLACANPGALTLMQTTAQNQYTHHLALPGSSGGIGSGMISPKRMFMSPLGSGGGGQAPSMINGGGRSPQQATGGPSLNQPPMAMTMHHQMAYYNQPNTAQTTYELHQHPHQQHHQLPPPDLSPYSQAAQGYSAAAYYGGSSGGEMLQQPPPPPPPTEYKFPPAISVQRLAPQVQRQLRETQELIKDSSSQLYTAGYGSPGPPMRNPNRNPVRNRPTLETQFSQELS